MAGVEMGKVESSLKRTNRVMLFDYVMVLDASFSATS